MSFWKWPARKPVAATAADYIDAYNRALDDKELCPNGDDFNDLCQELRHILAGGEPARVELTSKGR
jgi:hypothetical protein